MTEEWHWGSDAWDEQYVLAIEGGTGGQTSPSGAMLQARGDQQGALHVTDAAFSADPNVGILVRAEFSTWLGQDETEEDAPPAKRVRGRKKPGASISRRVK